MFFSILIPLIYFLVFFYVCVCYEKCLSKMKKLWHLMITVKFEGRRYYVPLKDKIRIAHIKNRLWIKRQYRRFRELIAKEGQIYILVVILWVIFAVITVYWNKAFHIEDHSRYGLSAAIWDLRSSIFSSVVITASITAFTRGRVYTEKIRNQHAMYCETMRIFNEVFTPFIGQERQRYMPLYSKLTLEQTLAHIKNTHMSNEGTLVVNKERFNRIVLPIINQFDRLNQYIHEERLVWVDYSDALKENLELLFHSLGYHSTMDIHNENGLDYAKVCLKGAIKEIEETDEKYIIPFRRFVNITFKLLSILDLLRTPWRKDIEDKIKVLKIINKNPDNYIWDDFYYKMLLEGHLFDSVN